MEPISWKKVVSYTHEKRYAFVGQWKEWRYTDQKQVYARAWLNVDAHSSMECKAYKTLIDNFSQLFVPKEDTIYSTEEICFILYIQTDDQSA